MCVARSLLLTHGGVALALGGVGGDDTQEVEEGQQGLNISTIN